MGLDDPWGQAHILISAVGRNGWSHGIPLRLAFRGWAGTGLAGQIPAGSHLSISDRPGLGLRALTLCLVETSVCKEPGPRRDSQVNADGIVVCISSHGAGGLNTWLVCVSGVR